MRLRNCYRLLKRLHAQMTPGERIAESNWLMMMLFWQEFLHNVKPEKRVTFENSLWDEAAWNAVEESPERTAIEFLRDKLRNEFRLKDKQAERYRQAARFVRRLILPAAEPNTELNEQVGSNAR